MTRSVNRYLEDKGMDRIDHALGRPVDPMRETYRMLLQGMIGMFQSGVGGDDGDDKAARRKAVTIATLCIGGMVMARTVDDAAFANEVREAARALALQIGAFDNPASSRAA